MSLKAPALAAGSIALFVVMALVLRVWVQSSSEAPRDNTVAIATVPEESPSVEVQPEPSATPDDSDRGSDDESEKDKKSKIKATDQIEDELKAQIDKESGVDSQVDCPEEYLAQSNVVFRCTVDSKLVVDAEDNAVGDHSAEAEKLTAPEVDSVDTDEPDPTSAPEVVEVRMSDDEEFDWKPVA